MVLCDGMETRKFKVLVTFDINDKVLKRENNNLELSINICFTDTILKVIRVWSS
jgi:hypothetical protein